MTPIDYGVVSFVLKIIIANVVGDEMGVVGGEGVFWGWGR